MLLTVARSTRRDVRRALQSSTLTVTLRWPAGHGAVVLRPPGQRTWPPLGSERVANVKVALSCDHQPLPVADEKRKILDLFRN